jgi:16S rRNA G966 N2-methylase RsmD
VQQHQGGEPYTLIMMDPPYADPKIHETLELVAHANLLVPGGILIVGHSIHVEFVETYGPLVRCEFRRFGGSCYTLFEMPEASDGGNP